MKPDAITALSQFAWPVLAAIIFGVLYPALREVMKSRAFTLKVGSMEVTVQQSLDSIQTDIKDLRQQVIALQERSSVPKALPAVAGASNVEPSATTRRKIASILWVDDNPSNNAYHILALREKGIAVEQAVSTSEAIRKLQSSHFDAVISDMVRKEDGKHEPQAGIALLRSMRELRLTLPVFVFSASLELKQQAEAEGAKILTSSTTELFRALRENGAPI